MSKKSKSVLAAITLAIGAFALGCSAQVEVKTPKQDPPKVVEPAPEPPKPEPAKPEYITISDRIQFESGKAVLKPESLPTLDGVAQVLAGNPHIKQIEIEGHTDDTGRSDMNMTLSQSRAEAVRDYLVRTRGVSETRLVPRGYGQSTPVADNHTYQGREQNRRVAFRILGQDS